MNLTQVFERLPANQAAAMAERLTNAGGWRALLDPLGAEWDRSTVLEKVMFLADVRGLTGLGVTELLEAVDETFAERPDVRRTARDVLPTLLDAALDLVAADRLKAKLVLGA